MSEEIKYSFKEMQALAQKVSGVAFSAEDLQLEEGENPTVDHIINYVRPLAEAKLQKEFDKGRKKAANKIEKAIKSKFKNVNFSADDSEVLAEELFSYVEGLTDKSKNITYEQALSIPKISEQITLLQEKANNYQALEEKYNNYRFNISILDYAKSYMSKNGYKLSSNEVRRAKQIESILAEISNSSFIKDKNGRVVLDKQGLPVIANEDGEVKMKELGEAFGFGDFIENVSPVDRIEIEEKPTNNPPKGGGSGFNISKADATPMAYDKAIRNGETEKAAMIKQAIMNNSKQ